MKTIDTNTADHYPFLTGGGEMGTLTGQYDWSTTPLGNPDQWPTSLRILLNMMLTSRFPMLIFWGPELTTFYNDAFRPSLGNNGKHPSSLGQRGEQSWAESWPVIGPMIHTIMAGGAAVWFEDQKLPIYRDGQMDYAYWTYSFSPLLDDTNGVNGVLVTCAETTAAVLARQQAEESQQQVLSFFEQSPVGIAIISEAALTFQMANPFYGYLVGRQPDQLVGKPLLEALPELAGQGFDHLLREVIATGKPYIATEVAVDVVRQDHLETIYVDLTYRPRREADQRISGILVVATDVTQQVRSRNLIRESETKLRSLLAQAPVATGLFVGRELIIELANEPMLQLWSKGHDVFNKPLARVLPELVGQPFLNILDEVYTTGQPYQASADRCDLLIGGQLRTFYFNFTYQPIFDQQGQVYAILDMAVDVTEQVIAQQQLEASEVFAQNLLYSSPVANLVLLGEAMIVQTINEGMLMMLGRTASIIGMPFMDAMPELSATSLLERLRQVLRTGEPFHQPEERIELIRYGQNYSGYYHYIYTALRDGSNQPVGVVVTAIEVTQQVLARQRVEASEMQYRRLSEELERQVQLRTEELAASNEELAAINEELTASNEELSASYEETEATNEELTESNYYLARSNDNLERFAYVASHDLQEPLRKIQSFGDLLKERYGDQLGDGAAYLARMQLAASRMSTLIRDLLTYSRISTQRDRSKPVPLAGVINQVLMSLDLLIQETGAVVHVDALPILSGDPLQLEQLFQNLIGNALKFRRPGASPLVHIRSSLVLNKDLPVSVKPAKAVMSYHQIEVSDNGIGFDEKYLDRIFQVFQRLHGKNEFAGTGIGLAIVQKVVDNHGGAITASSTPGQGATFIIYLPAEV